MSCPSRLEAPRGQELSLACSRSIHTQHVAWLVVRIQDFLSLNELIKEWMSYAKNKQPISPNNSVVETSSKHWQP